MSLTSYRAAPPRGKACEFCISKTPKAGLRGRPRRRKKTDKSAAFCMNGRADAVEDVKRRVVLGRPGNDLLSRVLRHSTIGAEEFNGRVRDGIGFLAPRSDHRTSQGQQQGRKTRHPELFSSRIKQVFPGSPRDRRSRKADRPPRPMARIAKGTDVPAGV